MVIITLVVAFGLLQKYTLPPVITFFSLLKCYIITIPWIGIKRGFSWLFQKLGDLWEKLRGIEEEYELESEVTAEEEG